MKRIWQNLWRDQDGVLSFEWTLLTAVVVFGIVSGLSAARDTIIDELGDLAQAVVRIDQSFSFSGIAELGILPSSYDDIQATVTDCSRQPNGSWGIPGRNDATGGG
jgi:Flp pilus assembly pilin Flp